MRDILLVITVVGSFSCADKKPELSQLIEQPRFESPGDTFVLEGKTIFKEYIGEEGRLVTEEEKTYFEADDREGILVKVNLSIFNPRLVDVADYDLSLQAFQTTKRRYDKQIWDVHNEHQSPLGIWGVFKKYYKTVEFGCCSTEDGYRLYDLKTGKFFLSHTSELQYGFSPTWNYTGYQASNSTTFDPKSAKDIIGNLYYIEIDANSDKAVLHNYDVWCQTCADDARFEHTPDFAIAASSVLRDEGFFTRFQLYKDGILLSELDTAEYYLVLEYDTKLRTLIPVVDSGLVLDRQLSTDPDLSTDLVIKRR